MSIQARNLFTNQNKHVFNWYRLAVLLAILALVLAACGGGDTGNSGNTDNTGQTDNGDGDDTSLSSTNATDKGTLELGVTVTDSIALGEAHSYQFAGTSGEKILIKMGATGSTFYAPYVFLYGSDGTLIASNDTTLNNRSKRLEQTLEADDTYTIVVQPVGDIGAGGYELSVEQQAE